ncbi:hypothetical protein TREES_T100021528 [Tupaia chinensis]|uniref:Uncharacterized protein n=1 Tax=Tupaia chinensis TaxID=246437 RepID=L9KFF0_TUPCH|nr:hypothetical protein TREES_T100021528 [Tupaia chinensis]
MNSFEPPVGTGPQFSQVSSLKFHPCEWTESLIRDAQSKAKRAAWKRHRSQPNPPSKQKPSWSTAGRACHPPSRASPLPPLLLVWPYEGTVAQSRRADRALLRSRAGAAVLRLAPAPSSGAALSDPDAAPPGCQRAPTRGCRLCSPDFRSKLRAGARGGFQCLRRLGRVSVQHCAALALVLFCYCVALPWILCCERFFLLHLLNTEHRSSFFKKSEFQVRRDRMRQTVGLQGTSPAISQSNAKKGDLWLTPAVASLAQRDLGPDTPGQGHTFRSPHTVVALDNPPCLVLLLAARADPAPDSGLASLTLILVSSAVARSSWSGFAFTTQGHCRTTEVMWWTCSPLCNL